MGNNTNFFGCFLLIIVVLILVAIVVNDKEKREDENKKAKIKTIEQNKHQLREYMNLLSQEGFSRTKSISDTKGRYQIEIDSLNKRLAILSSDSRTPIILIFSEIIGSDIIQDNSTILSGGVGRAVIGGLIAGGAGAVVGAATRKSKDVISDLRININTKNIDDPLITLKLITTQTERSSSEYKEALEFAEKVQATMESILSQNLG